MAALIGPLGSVVLGTLPLGGTVPGISVVPLPEPPYRPGICAEADYLVSRLDAAIAKYQPLQLTLQRIAIDPATGETFVFRQVADIPAFILNFVPQDLDAGEVQDIRVTISPRWLETFGLPERDDQIITKGNPSNVEQIGPKYFCGQCVRVNMLCRG
jgi:hypothetical protein